MQMKMMDKFLLRLLGVLLTPPWKVQSEFAKALEENKRLRAEIRRLKGEGG